MERTEALTFVLDIRRAVRTHRDQVGDYRCWVDDVVLYHRVLPELRGTIPPVPPTDRFMQYCTAYFDRRQDPSEPVRDIPLSSREGPLLLVYGRELDSDLDVKGDDAVKRELTDWHVAVRAHREKGPLRLTFEDDMALYLMLPEKLRATTQLPPRESFLGKNCPAYALYCQSHTGEFASGLWK